MQRNFILTDIMKTGNHQQLEQFVNLHSIADQTFDMTGEYYSLHSYDLDSYDRRFAIIDTSPASTQFFANDLFRQEIKKRCNLLHSQGFVFIKANPWESLYNIENLGGITEPQEMQVDHVKWTGGVSWFWFYMYQKHKHNKFNFTHDHNGSYWHKKHDFLYLNKSKRHHRIKLYDKLIQTDILENSIHTFRYRYFPDDHPGNVLLDSKYELPGIIPRQYPKIGMDQDIYEPPYNDTVCSLVAETNDTDYEVFITEKLWKPIIAQHVFVIHGNHLYLQKLREMGFKTFSNHFDESYDLERDPDKRINAIVTLLKDLKSKCDSEKWQDIYLQTQALRKHNYDTFFDEQKLSVQINKTLELFLEFADTGQVPS